MNLRYFSLSLALTAIAASSAQGRGLVLESHAGPRESTSQRLLGPTTRGFGDALSIAPPTMLELIGRTMAASGESLSAPVLAGALQSIDAGYSRFLRGEFEQARTELAGALDTLGSRPATVARDQPLRDKVIKALIGIAVASQRLDDSTRAEATMAEFLRSFPDREISRATYGPEPIELAKKVKAKLDATGKGGLAITTDDPTAVVFVNERFVGVGDTTLSGLYPGQYRVYTQRAKREGRVHTVTVDAARETRLFVSVRMEGSLRTGPDWVALFFESAQERDAEEVARASELANELGENQIVLVGLGELQRQRRVIATLVDSGSRKIVRRAAIPAGAAQGLVASLVAYVIEGKISPEIERLDSNATSTGVMTKPQPRAAAAARRPGGRGLRIAGIVTAGVGVLTLGGGIYFGLQAGSLEDDIASAKVWSSALANKVDDGEAAARNANILIGVGAACVVGGGVMWYLGHRAGRRAERTVEVHGAVTPTSAGLVIAGSFR